MIIYKPFAKIQALTFDLDDTLYNNWPYIVEAERLLLDFVAREYPGDQTLNKHDWQQHKRQALRDDPALWSDMGDLRRVTLSAGLSQIGYTQHALKDAVQRCYEYFYFQRSNFQVSEAVKQTLADLAARVPLVAITNGNVNLEQIGIAEYFQQTYKANRAHPMKPNRSMFDMAAQYLSLPANQILHVGDNLEKDVWGAIQGGYKAAWFACDRPMQVQSEPVQVLPHVQLDHLNELQHLF